uniref:Uncharacterized protein n=1 Tax=Chromera velia CCMP2878 TaxID=1169474 RepID=A0A0G4GLS9_9ALVE|eukprot:Cvel_4880.t1-p1 / transcript=Cvel_4880.t1 / gene=Cvel_4880 / organism=Chromera_velia_CCMP2878 / gene_product=hypothetical protein / transcript_product=hypothetical protein / location=Cvel_scaffold220:44917-45466(+) / protein_length=73 / sequence_SO=supercontig / SO=protein_coding / is_pseudo=false
MCMAGRGDENSRAGLFESAKDAVGHTESPESPMDEFPLDMRKKTSADLDTLKGDGKLSGRETEVAPLYQNAVS